MPKDDSRVVKVESNNVVVGTLSLKNILSVYITEMNDELKGRPPISIKRKLLKIAVMGRKYTTKK